MTKHILGARCNCHLGAYVFNKAYKIYIRENYKIVSTEVLHIYGFSPRLNDVSHCSIIALSYPYKTHHSN